MRFVVACLIAIVTCAHAKIIEFDSFKNLTSHITKDSIVILDIDDTLLITKQMLGCDEWFLRRLQFYQDNKAPVPLEKALAEFEAIRHLTEMEIVEKGTDEIVKNLQAQGYRIIGLTTQGLALATRTVAQLLENKIDLTVTAFSKEDCFLDFHQHGILFRKGILFTSGQPKGEALFLLCDKLNIKPKRIVFVNDKQKHLADVEKTAQERGVDFIGLRYNYSDGRKAAFNPEIANYQFFHSHFGHIMSDDEAKLNINKK